MLFRSLYKGHVGLPNNKSTKTFAVNSSAGSIFKVVNQISKIEIEFYDEEDLERIYEIITN